MPLFYQFDTDKNFTDILKEKEILEFSETSFQPEFVLNTSLSDAKPIYLAEQDRIFIKFTLQKAYVTPESFEQTDYRYPIVLYFDLSNQCMEIRYDAIKYTDSFDSEIYEKLVVSCLVNYYRRQHKYPAPSDTFEEAINIESHNLVEEYKYSGFWGYTLLCIFSLDFESLYNEIKEFLKDDLEQVAKCIWFLRKNEEEIYYERCAMNLVGEGVELPVEMEYSDFKRKAEFILSHYKNEKMSFDEFNFESLEIIICRYYRYIPRINANFLFPQPQ